MQGVLAWKDALTTLFGTKRLRTGDLRQVRGAARQCGRQLQHDLVVLVQRRGTAHPPSARELPCVLPEDASERCLHKHAQTWLSCSSNGSLCTHVAVNSIHLK